MNEIGRYLSGESFTDDLPYKPEIVSHPQPRGDVLTHWVAGRRVLHVGFADHVPLIASRVSDGSWLHARLTRNASECHGIDINPKAVETARGLGFDNVHVLDIFSPDAPRAVANWRVDLVMVPDVIEHVPDPAAFLQRLVHCLPSAEFVVSVPNALSLRNAIQAATGVERINTDHRVYFSPFTLLKVLWQAGLEATSLHGCQVTTAGSFKGKLLRTFAERRPIWSDVLLANARARSGAL
jgi:hypothetical protein